MVEDRYLQVRKMKVKDVVKKLLEQDQEAEFEMEAGRFSSTAVEFKFFMATSRGSVLKMHVPDIDEEFETELNKRRTLQNQLGRIGHIINE